MGGERLKYEISSLFEKYLSFSYFANLAVPDSYLHLAVPLGPAVG